MSSKRLWLAAVVLASVSAGALRSAAPRFYPDDPIQVDDDRALDASAALPIEGSNAYDFAEHTFFKRGDRRSIRAVNVNTMDEVPDSSWFTNRIGRRPMSIDEIAEGPNRLATLNVDGWPIVQEKSAGITPGFRLTDPEGHLYQLKFDPPEHPEMSSGAEVIGAAIYHAIGYNVVEGYIVEFDPAKAVISPKATTVDMAGRRRALRLDDIERVLQRAARLPNGKYRALASRFAEGRNLGYFKYYGTRPDDPNDIHPHEHRRELRGNRVFSAWLNHDDSRGLNSLDMLETRDGRAAIRHYMFDFGSTLGSGSTAAQVPRAGNEYILEWGPALKTLFSLGLWTRPWIRVEYPNVAKSVGRFEAGFFDPAAWRPEYPNPAFDNMRADDAFWAADLISRFSDEAIRAVVEKADYSEQRAADYVTATLIARKKKVLAEWLTGVNPIVKPELAADGAFTFENAAVRAGVSAPPSEYVLTWSRFDNASGSNSEPTEEVRTSAPRATAPRAVLEGSGFVSVAIRSLHKEHPLWERPVTVHFRRTANGWQAVGLTRLD
jgi:hypothetical protein